jgi:serine protease Do
VFRQNREHPLTLELPAGWRRSDDISWRVAAWQLSRIGLGGMRLEAVTAAERKRGAMLKVSSVGMYGPHATAMNVGLKKGDLLLSYDGKTELSRESEVFAYVNDNLTVGQQVPVKVLRGSQTLEFSLPIQP